MQISLKAARVNANLRQKEAAEALGVDVSTLLSWEKGKTYPKINQMQEMSRLYHCPIDAIFLPMKSTKSGQEGGRA